MNYYYFGREIIDHNKKDAEIKSSDINMSKQFLLVIMAIFKMTSENKCEDGKASTSETRIKTLSEIGDNINHQSTWLYKYKILVYFMECKS